MKWLEFAIWMWREMGLRAFLLFLMGLWAISWALVPGPRQRVQDAPWGRVRGESWAGNKGEGAMGMCQPPYNNSWSAVFI